MGQQTARRVLSKHMIGRDAECGMLLEQLRRGSEFGSMLSAVEWFKRACVQAWMSACLVLNFAVKRGGAGRVICSVAN